MPAYYDYVLASIPLSLVGVASVLTLAGFGLTQAVSLSALISIAVIGHALFIRGPTPTPSGEDGQKNTSFGQGDESPAQTRNAGVQMND